jgi:hypothetical protein
MSVLTINFPETISAKLSNLANKNKSEIEKFVLIAVAEKLDYLEERAKRAKFDDFENILAKIPDVKPETFDQIQ